MAAVLQAHMPGGRGQIPGQALHVQPCLSRQSCNLSDVKNVKLLSPHRWLYSRFTGFTGTVGRSNSLELGGHSSFSATGAKLMRSFPRSLPEGSQHTNIERNRIQMICTNLNVQELNIKLINFPIQETLPNFEALCSGFFDNTLCFL